MARHVEISDAEIERLDLEGLSLKEIGEKMGFDYTSIFKHIKALRGRRQLQSGQNDFEETKALVLKGKSGLEVKINMIGQLKEVNKAIIADLRFIKKNLKNEKVSLENKMRLMARNKDISEALIMQHKFAREVAHWVEDMEFRRIVIEEISKESQEVKERINARLQERFSV